MSIILWEKVFFFSFFEIKRKKKPFEIRFDVKAKTNKKKESFGKRTNPLIYFKKATKNKIFFFFLSSPIFALFITSVC